MKVATELLWQIIEVAVKLIAIQDLIISRWANGDHMPPPGLAARCAKLWDEFDELMKRHGISQKAS